MRETNLPAPLTVYRLRVVVRGVSPLIWRRLLVPADTTIAGLHAVLQIAFGWTGTHLHRFVVQGREYGIGYVGGPGFGDDPRRVRLGDLGLRRTERFTYHYDFTAGWCLDLRVEQVLAAEPGRPLPVCAGGRRAGPPEDCGGVQAFLESTQPSHVVAAAVRAVEILGMLLDDGDVPRFGEHRDRLSHVAQNYVRADSRRGERPTDHCPVPDRRGPVVGQVVCSSRWTGCGSWCRCAPLMPVRTRTTSAEAAG